MRLCIGIFATIQDEQGHVVLGQRRDGAVLLCVLTGPSADDELAGMSDARGMTTARTCVPGALTGHPRALYTAKQVAVRPCGAPRAAAVPPRALAA